MEPRLSIVVAVKDGASNVPALLGALKGRDGSTEVILCCAGSADCNADVSQFSFPAETLVPTLWSEGILRARGYVPDRPSDCPPQEDQCEAGEDVTPRPARK